MFSISHAVTSLGLLDVYLGVHCRQRISEQEFIDHPFFGVPGLYLKGVKTSSFIANKTLTLFLDRTRINWLLILEKKIHIIRTYTRFSRMAANCSTVLPWCRIRRSGLTGLICFNRNYPYKFNLKLD